MKCWLPIGALMLTSLANAQGHEIVFNCQKSSMIPLNIESTWDRGPALARETTARTSAASPNATPDPWAFSLTTSGYLVPGSQSHVSPEFSADRGWLHLEVR